MLLSKLCKPELLVLVSVVSTWTSQYKSPLIFPRIIFKTARVLQNAFQALQCQYSRSLKALVFERIGKLEEALTFCFNAKDTCPDNGLTLSTFHIVFQQLDHLDLARFLHEYACGKIPNNTGLLMDLFNCYIHEFGTIKTMQLML